MHLPFTNTVPNPQQPSNEQSEETEHPNFPTFPLQNSDTVIPFLHAKHSFVIAWQQVTRFAIGRPSG